MQNQPEEINSAPIGQLLIVGFLSIVAVTLSIYYFSRPAAEPVTPLQTSGSFDASASLGIDESDSVAELSSFSNGKLVNFIVLFESGRSLIIDQKFNILAEGDNQPVDLTRELPRSIISLRKFKDGFIGGTANGRLDYYVAQNQKLIVKQEIDYFQSPGAIDAIASTGSITHILTNQSASRIVAFNFDGAGRIYSAGEAPDFKKISTIQLSAGVVSAAFAGDSEFWALSSDGKLSVFDVSSPEARLIFEVSEYGRLSGADYNSGKFLVYGYSLELKVPSVAIYGNRGDFIDLLTTKGATAQQNQQANPEIDESNLPVMTDIGSGYRDARWLEPNLIGAVSKDTFYRIETDKLKIDSRRFDLKPYEQLTRFLRLSNGDYIFGTTAGRILRKSLN